MMVYIIWEFRIRPEQREAFEHYYASDGQWAELFRRSPAYIATTLAQDIENLTRYLVTDAWETLEAFRNFKRHHLAEYEQLDKTCEALTLEEKYWGTLQIPE